MGGILGMMSGAGLALVTPVTNTYNTAGANVDTVPVGAKQRVVEIWGGGATGGAVGATSGGGGGGSGGYVKTVTALTPADWGKNITVTVGAAGASSTAVAGTDALATMTAGGGNIGSPGSGAVGGAPGTGGSASGGINVNTIGATGTIGTNSVTVGGPGGPGIVGTNGTGNAGGHGGNTQSGGTLGLAVVQYT